LEEGEVALYQPKPHWMVLVKPFLALAGIVVALIARCVFYPIDTANFLLSLLAKTLDGIIIASALGWVIFYIRKILVYMMVEYYLTNKRLILKRGVLFTHLVDMPIEKIESLHCLQGIGGYLFNYSTIAVSGMGGMQLCFKTVKKPYAVRRKIYDLIEKNRKITIIREERPRIIEKREVEIKAVDYGTFVTSYPSREKAQ
jgi:uncharacterized membrane protein YdbT with pleckstrin-like domain